MSFFYSSHKITPSGDLCTSYNQLNKIRPEYVYEDAYYSGTLFEKIKCFTSYKSDIYYLPYMRKYIVVLFKNTNVKKVEDILISDVQRELKESHEKKIKRFNKHHKMNGLQKIILWISTNTPF